MRCQNVNPMGGCVMRKNLVFGLVVMVVWLLGGQTVCAQQSDDKAHAALAKALTGVKVP